jgi:hypothetical protein
MTAHVDTKVYVGAGNHDLLWILWTGFQDGLAYGRSHPARAPYLEPDDVVGAAKIAYERKLQVVEPLDRAAFHPAYTYGWMTGYLAAHYDLDDAVDGLALLDPPSLIEYAHQTDTRPITH